MFSLSSTFSSNCYCYFYVRSSTAASEMCVLLHFPLLFLPLASCRTFLSVTYGQFEWVELKLAPIDRLKRPVTIDQWRHLSWITKTLQSFHSPHCAFLNASVSFSFFCVSWLYVKCKCPLDTGQCSIWYIILCPLWGAVVVVWIFSFFSCPPLARVLLCRWWPQLVS